MTISIYLYLINQQMTLNRLIYILGFVLIIYSIIGGLSVQCNFNDVGSDVHTEYSFKIGTFILGLIFIYFGRKSKGRGEGTE